MKKTFIIANWKSNKTILEAEEWFQTFNNLQLTINKEKKKVIVCPPFTLLPKAKELAGNCQLPIVVGAQDISPFDKGAYTGEINGKQIKEFADYVIIGHSERRENFLESDEMLFKKVELANKNGLNPIFCVQGKDTKIPQNVEIVAYEPIFAIGSGNPDTPDNAEQVAKYIKENSKAQLVLYGGSVASKNVKDFTQMPNIGGALVGGASLDAKEFYAIIQNA